jgi:transposase
LRYGTRNIERRAVGSDTCASASTASENGPSRQRPPHRGGGHPVDRPHRSALWRDLPEEFGPWQSIATRFYRWVEAGVWDHVLAELQRQADAERDLDWNLHHIDGTSVRAHQHAAGAKKGEALTTQQRRQKKIRRQRKPSDEAEADSRPRSTCALRATANPSPS